MRRSIYLVAALVFVLPASAAPRRRTVLDYFKMLPSKYFEVENQFPRLKSLREGFKGDIEADNRSVVDLKNDFLRFPGGDGQGRLDVAVFRFHGQDTIAISDRYEGTDLSFYREKNGRLVDVTKQVFPFRLPETVTHVLPRMGTTIRVLKGGWPDEPSKTGYARFFWRGGHFIKG